jgi:hypothetical protein
LEVYDEIRSLDQGNVPMHKRSRTFDSVCKSFHNMAVTGEKNQFQTIIISVGDSIHNDAGLVDVYESEGLKGVCCTLPFDIRII